MVKESGHSSRIRWRLSLLWSPSSFTSPAIAGAHPYVSLWHCILASTWAASIYLNWTSTSLSLNGIHTIIFKCFLYWILKFIHYLNEINAQPELRALLKLNPCNNSHALKLFTVWLIFSLFFNEKAQPCGPFDIRRSSSCPWPWGFGEIKLGGKQLSCRLYMCYP